MGSILTSQGVFSCKLILVVRLEPCVLARMMMTGDGSTESVFC